MHCSSCFFELKQHRRRQTIRAAAHAHAPHGAHCLSTSMRHPPFLHELYPDGCGFQPSDLHPSGSS